MADTLWDVVDVGYKHGGSLRSFLKYGTIRFGNDVRRVMPERCLAVDRTTEYCDQARADGFHAELIDLLGSADVERLPAASYYLLWDLLEHLQSLALSKAVLRRALEQSRDGVWACLPSFEQDDDTGEGVLRKHGLRFAWTTWKCHRTPFRLADAREVIDGFRKAFPERPFVLRIEPTIGRITSTSDHAFVVPENTPAEVLGYSPELGPRPRVTFDRPVVLAWDVTVRFNKKETRP